MSTALYRRYRPETFADVIGQEHVTDPLMSALRGERISHAYLFSGPRGCGKTTSARIFARCLNCAQGPTDTPCGTCPSCVELARDGAGSLDVVEMDAASHGGVDDARELRERAAFAPARDRYKVFIIDEAHMVTNQGFNALLKLVEEPPAHVKFVFATTEPEKVIGTIRSRTHHYPFRLVPPERLQAYLEELCAAEQVEVEAGVLPLVVRAGGGSVRDSLSVLDQLIAGAQDGRIDYERAVALLGYTHATLLDDVVDAIATLDGAALFRVVDRVIGSGHDPRRFAEDLLERLRDLIVIAVSGEHAQTVLRSLPRDQVDRMRVQAQQLGPAQLSRSGDLVNEALTEMSGATSPRLQLELLCARLLLPAAGDGARGFGARLERLEHQLAGGAVPPPARPAAAVPAPEAAEPAVADPGAGGDPAGSGAAAAGAGPDAPPPHADRPSAPEPPRPQPAPERPAPARPAPDRPAPARPAADRPVPEPQDAPRGDHPARPQPPQEPPAPAAPAASPASGGAGAGHVDAEMVRRRWPEVLSTLARFKRTTWALVSQNAQVGDVSGGVLQLAFTTSGLAHTFRSGQHAEPLQRALSETLGVDVRIEPVLGPAAQAGGGPTRAPSASWGTDTPSGGAASAWGAASPAATPRPETGDAGPATHGAPGRTPGAPGAQSGPGAGPAATGRSGPPPGPEPAGSAAPGPAAPLEGRAPDAATGAPAPGATTAAAHASPSAATAVVSPVSAASAPASAPSDDRSAPSPATAYVAPGDDTPSMDDPDAENSELSGARLIETMLGGTIIEETEDLDD